MSQRASRPTGKISDRTMNLVHRIRVATGEAVGAMLADLDLNGTQALILETLGETGATSAAELARRALVTRQALTSPLNELQSRGLVARPPGNVNARTRPVALTEDGLALVAALRERMRLIEDSATAGFAAGEIETLRTLLARYATAWEQLAADGPRLRTIAAEVPVAVGEPRRSARRRGA
ncbi:MarR family transcriptional regulator [Amycolatopsis bartoniae]|nr:MarR family transcriptional regulator [Amycolatopsis bartoniae]TVT10175.1 MarR family transcriptional regulator [Amycolatopsis bartoniae]